MTSRLATFGFILLTGLASTAMASDNAGGYFSRHQPQSFSEDTVRTFADGGAFKRHVQQTVSAGGVTRQINETNPQGQTASRTVTMTFNKGTQTWTRTVQGTRFDGKTYSMSAQGQGFPGGHRHRMGGGDF